MIRTNQSRPTNQCDSHEPTVPAGPPGEGSSSRTEDAYHDWCRRFILFHNKRHPREMGAAEINQFLTHLAVEGHVSASTQNQAFCALLFLYRDVLQVDPGLIAGVIRAQRPKRLPVVLTRGEVQAVLGRMDGVPRVVGLLLYGSGRRVLEALRLRVHDLDLVRIEVLVRGGEGDKDRRTMLPGAAKPVLVGHLDAVRAAQARDLAEGFGTVYLPNALDRKYPHANRELGWQYVFPARTRFGWNGFRARDWPHTWIFTPAAPPQFTPASPKMRDMSKRTGKVGLRP